MSYIKTADKFNVRLIPPLRPDLHFIQSKTGKDGFQLEFVNDAGESITTVLWLSPAAYERSVQVLSDVFGFDGNFSNFAKGRSTFTTLEASIQTEIEDYEAKDGTMKQKAVVRWINPARNGGFPATSDIGSTLQRLARLAGGDQKPVTGSRPNPRPLQPPIKTADGLEDEEIPF